VVKPYAGKHTRDNDIYCCSREILNQPESRLTLTLNLSTSPDTLASMGIH